MTELHYIMKRNHDLFLDVKKVPRSYLDNWNRVNIELIISDLSFCHIFCNLERTSLIANHDGNLIDTKPLSLLFEISFA
jgi:hypothetical protein